MRMRLLIILVYLTYEFGTKFCDEDRQEENIGD